MNFRLNERGAVVGTGSAGCGLACNGCRGGCTATSGGLASDSSALVPTVTVDPAVSALLRTGLEHLVDQTDGSESQLVSQSDAAGSLLADAVPELVERAAQLRAAGGPIGVIVDGVPVEVGCLEQTPLADLASLAIAKVLGEPFGFAQKKGGKLVFPLRTRAGYEGAVNTSFGSGVFRAHVDNAGFAPDFCGDAFVLTGVRNDSGVATSVIPVTKLRSVLPAEVLAVLEQGRFTHSVTAGFAFRMNVTTRPAPVFRRGDGGEWHIAISADGCRPAKPGDAEAQEALRQLENAANDPANAIPVVIGPGRALIVSQRRCLHQRAAFRGERLVLRTYVAWDLGPFRAKTGKPGPVFDAWELLR